MIKRLRPGQLLVAGYSTVGLIGTVLLMLPWASSVEGSSTFLQALFTAISALTATGLTVVATGTHWTLFGQTVILILIQIGGLGLMVITTIFLILLGMRIQLGLRYLIVQDRNHFNVAGVLRLVKSVVKLTLTIEGIGAVLIALLAPGVWNNGLLEGLFFVLFHTVSAFNGAGFDLTGQSLEPFRNYPGLYLVFISLILLGSLGYVVLQELLIQRRWHKPSLHSRLVLWVTGIITLLGSTCYFFTEYNDSMARLPLENKIVESLFQSVTRTAGFTSVPISNWSEPFIFLMILMMFIGASPGSVGGGIKTTTIGTIVLAVWAIARGKKEVVIMEREISSESVNKAFTVTIIALILVCTSTFILMIIEKLPFLPVLFEVVSAFATVGLSLGITQQLSSIGQILIILLMFVGRIGVLSLVIFLAKQEYRRLRYMKEEILIG
ncbi:TrkH family potassium uptake protein [Desulfolucanica intricata]|uniref:TrkH family potassium uptake protein n=1 Tax=Desulfolucanica intricata TaxID=1285191 RepID=UPI000833C0E7|nr:potassium transporter TrkG [Desulfolucanica intricata]